MNNQKLQRDEKKPGRPDDHRERDEDFGNIETGVPGDEPGLESINDAVEQIHEQYQEERKDKK